MRLALLPLRDSFNISLSHHRASFPCIKPQFWCGLLPWEFTAFRCTLCFLGFLAWNGCFRLLCADLLWPI